MTYKIGYAQIVLDNLTIGQLYINMILYDIIDFSMNVMYNPTVKLPHNKNVSYLIMY
jgi:hypothetical protein